MFFFAPEPATEIFATHSVNFQNVYFNNFFQLHEKSDFTFFWK